MEKETKIFGLRAIIEAINAGNDIEKVYLLKENQGAIAKELLYLIRKNNISVSYVPVEKLNKLSRNQNHQGAVAKISEIAFVELDDLITEVIEKDTVPLFLILDQITDVRNLGAIIRTAECTGVNGIILPIHGSAPINADAIKTSAGAAFNIPICKVNHTLDAIYQLQAADIKTVAVTEKTSHNYYDIDLKIPVALIMGSEHKGITSSILKIADFKGKLPILGDIDSLNVSVACGVALYEVVRQRGLF